MAFLAAINQRKKIEGVDATSTSARASIQRSRPSVDSTNVRSSVATMTRPSMVSRPSLLKRGSISFCIESETTLTEGREGPQLRSMSQKIRDNKDLTDEKVDLIYEAFQTFPLNEHGILTSESLGDYYSKCGLVFTPDECDKMMSLFIGAPCKSINFEDFALAFIRCEKTLPVRARLLYIMSGFADRRFRLFKFR